MRTEDPLEVGDDAYRHLSEGEIFLAGGNPCPVAPADARANGRATAVRLREEHAELSSRVELAGSAHLDGSSILLREDSGRDDRPVPIRSTP